MARPQQAQPFTKSRVLIGEGRDEVRFFGALLTHLGVTDVQVEEYAGKANLSLYLREFRLRPRNLPVIALGVTRDADDQVAQVFESITTLLNNNGLPVPAAAGQVAPGPPRVGVFILPDNQQTGMLEDLCYQGVQGDGALTCVEEFFRCVARDAGRQPKPIAKGKIHAWLASQIVPDLRLGEAAEKNYFPWAAAPFQPLIQFLQGL